MGEPGETSAHRRLQYDNRLARYPVFYFIGIAHYESQSLLFVECAVGLRSDLRHNRPVHANEGTCDVYRDRSLAFFLYCFHVNGGVGRAGLKMKAGLEQFAVMEMAERAFRKLGPIGHLVPRVAPAEYFSRLVAAQFDNERTVRAVEKTERAKQPDIVGFALAAVEKHGESAGGDIVFEADLVVFLIGGYLARGSSVPDGRNRFLAGPGI